MMLIKGIVKTLFLIVTLMLLMRESLSSHFSYGTITYERPQGTSNLVYNMNFAYRTGYFGTKKVGDYFSVDGYFRHLYSGVGQTNTILYITVKEVYAAQSWLYGYISFTKSLTDSQASSIVGYYDLCCRINDIADSNNSDTTYVRVRGDAITRWRSPVAAGLPRITLSQMTPIRWTASAISYDNYPLTFGVNLDSGLTKPFPCGSSSGCTGTNVFSMDANGVGSWTPRYVHKYAISIRTFDGVATVYTDFLFVVEAVCLPTDRNCNHPPVFDPPLPAFVDVYIGSAFSHTFIATDQDGDSIEIITVMAAPAEGFTMVTNKGSGRSTITHNWFPDIDMLSTSVCYQLIDSRGKYGDDGCVTFRLVQADYILVSGTIRDFNAGGDFGVTAPTSARVTPVYYQDNLDGNKKPVWKDGVAVSTPYTPASKESFNKWWSNDAAKGVYLHTVILIHKASTARVFSLMNNKFYPIDNVPNADLDSNGNNRYFTYEVHTYFEYLGGEQYTFQSNDDLFIFINGKAVPNWNLHGVKNKATPQVISMDSLRVSHGLTKNDNYQMAIFYAQRSKDRDSFYGIEMSNSSNCNAINLLQQDPALLEKSWIFRYDQNNISPAASSSFVTSGTAAVKNGYLEIINDITEHTSSAGSAWFGINGKSERVKILNGFQTKFSFRMKSLVTRSRMEGFAFVIQDHSPNARGSEGANLGYSSLTKSVALEFDTATNTVTKDPSFEHIGVHTRYANENSAIENVANYPSGSTFFGNDNKLPLDMLNGTLHHVTVEVNPGILTFSFRVYMNDNIKPIFTTELDSKLMTAMFADGAYVGFTSSSSSSNAGYVRIEKWNMLVVPALASQSTPSYLPSSAKAGVPDYMEVQLKDACGNPVYASGEKDKFDASFKFSNAGNVNNPVTITDQGKGVYRFGFAPERSGIWNLAVTYTALDKKEYIANNQVGYAINIIPSFTSPAKSEFLWGTLEVDHTNTATFPVYQSASLPAAQGLACQPFNNLGGVASTGYRLADATQFKTWYNTLPKDTIVTCAVHSNMKTSAARNEMATLIGLSVTDSGPSVSLAFIAEKKTAGAFVANHVVQKKHDLNEAVQVVHESSTGIIYTAKSGATNRNAHAYVQAQTSQFSVASGGTGTFYIISRDIYGNLKTTDEEDVYLPSFSPTLGQNLALDVIPRNGYFTVNFGTGKSGIYTMSLTYSSQPVGASTRVYVNAGSASAKTSIALGAGVGGVAGSNINFQMNLKDVASNDVITQTVSEITDFYIQKIDDVSKKFYLENPAITYWDTASSSYKFIFSTKLAGQYNLFVFINGERHTGTVNTIINILAGEESARSIVYSLDVNGKKINPPTTVSAGVIQTVYIQSRDQYDNDRQATNVKNNFSVTPSTSADLVSDPVIQFISNGLYTLTYMHKTTKAITFKINLGTATILLLNSTPATWTPAVDAGEISTKSKFTLKDTTATANSNNALAFTINAIDEFNNVITKVTVQDVQTSLIVNAIASSTTFYYSSAPKINSCSAGVCQGSFNGVVKAATYSIQPVLSLSQQPIQGTGQFTITPDVTSAKNCLVNGASSEYARSTEFETTIIDADKYDNLRGGTDNKGFTCSLVYDNTSFAPIQGTVTSTTVAGQYKCTIKIGLDMGDAKIIFKHSNVEITTKSTKILAKVGELFAKVFVDNKNVDPSATGTNVANIVAGVSTTIVVKSYETNAYNTISTTITSLTLESYNNDALFSTLSASSTTGTFNFVLAPTLVQANTKFVIKASQVSDIHGKDSSKYTYYTFNVIPNKLDASRSSISFLPTSTAGEKYVIDIIPRDQYSNVITSGNNISTVATFKASNVPNSITGACAFANSVIQCSTSDLKIVGRYSIQIAFTGTNVIPNTTFLNFMSVYLNHAAIDPTKTILSLSSFSPNVFNSGRPTSLVAGKFYAFTYDRFDNICNQHGLTTALPNTFIFHKNINSPDAIKFMPHTSNVFAADVTFNAPSYIGYDVGIFSAAAGGGTKYTSRTVQVRSKVPSDVNTFITQTATATEGITKGISAADPVVISVDDEFSFYLHIKDADNNPWINSLTSIDGDLGDISISIIAEVDISDRKTTISPTINNVMLSSSTRNDGVFKFTVRSADYRNIGTYNINSIKIDGVQITGPNKDSKNLDNALFTKIIAGLPYADNSMITGLGNNLKANDLHNGILFLRDRQGNVLDIQDVKTTLRITRDMMLCPEPGHTEEEGTKWDDWVVADIDVNSGGYSVATVDTEYTFSKEVNGKWVDGKKMVTAYSFTILPKEAGIFTMNVTIASESSQSYQSCNVAQRNTLSVIPGNPDPTRSKYWILNSPRALEAGKEYTLRTQLVDKYFNNVTVSDVKLALGKRSDGTFHNDWITDDCDYKNNSQGKNCVSAKVTDYIDHADLGFKNGLIDIKFIPYKAGLERVIYLTMTDLPGANIGLDFVRITPGGPETVEVTHGLPDKVTLEPVKSTFTAGNSVTLSASVVDPYNNPVIPSPNQEQNHYVEAYISRRISTFTSNPPVNVGPYHFFAPVVTNTDGTVSFTFSPTWEGLYDVTLTLRQKLSNGEIKWLADTTATDIKFEHPTCFSSWKAANPTGNEADAPKFRCPETNKCVKAWTECLKADVPPASICSAEKPFRCEKADGSILCATNMSECPCPTDEVRVGSSCVAKTLVDQIATCPVGTVSCPTDPTQCRSNVKNCPSPAVCPNGYIICDDGKTCATQQSKCPVTSKPLVCSSPFLFQCGTGECVKSSSDCPTPKTCPANKVMCLTDGSCQTSADECPSPIVCPTGVKCPSGDCRDKLENCPSLVSCPVGWVLCEDNSCSSSLDKCAVLKESQLDCGYGKIRCSDGTCVESQLLCSSKPVCPANAPIMCSDKSCKPSLSQCVAPSTCASGALTCPDGTCVKGTTCPSPKICPIDKPVLCANKDCVKNASDCGSVTTCPPALPYSCPTGDCRASINDCPSQFVCPPSSPLKCPDGSCAVAYDTCTTETNTVVNDKTKCGEGNIVCPGGECAQSILLCPTHVTCPLGTTLCLDGRCAPEAECPVDTPSCSDYKLDGKSFITCPMASAGVACAKSFADCPLAPVCPVTAPVKCIDSTCATSLALCPPAPVDSAPRDRTPCPDGSWTVDSCPTPVTCPTFAPYKCYDQTCRATPIDCPVADPCPANTPYRCSSGSCASRPWDCTTPADTICSAGLVKCPQYNGIFSCVKDVSLCKNMYDDDVEGDRQYCAAGFIYCRDGSCKETASACPEYSCPKSYPFLCKDGTCALNELGCPLENGCDANTPIKCPGIGNCVENFSKCGTPSCSPYTPCGDGSCARDCSIRNPNGCVIGQFRCSDGSCVSEAALCTNRENSANSCPGNASYRCSNGFCAVSKSACPNMDNSVCPSSTPILCANGKCSSSADLCPILTPCTGPDMKRCDDGTCRNAATDPNVCPTFNSCPKYVEDDGTVVQWVRCKQSESSNKIMDGVCAPSLDSCPAVDGCPLVDGQLQRRCPNGRCISLTAPDSLCTSHTHTTTGCPAESPKKCWNGQCAKDITECPLENGCDITTPYLCPNGECSTGLSACPKNATDNVYIDTCAEGKIRCADGSCKKTCNTLFGCPLDKPVRCADGTCRRYSSVYRSPFYGLTDLSEACPPTIGCPSDAYIMCESGACVTDAAQCPPVTFTCGPKQSRCLFNEKGLQSSSTPKCVDDMAECETPSCPNSLPVLCPNGACVSDIINCDTNNDNQHSILTGSSTKSKPDQNGVYQVLCFDGSYKNSYLDCMNWAVEGTGNNSTQTEDICSGTICSDGTCIPTKNVKLCPSITSCPIESFRCADGSCRTSCKDVKIPKCKANEDLCQDGQCRVMGSCPNFNGCPFYENFAFACASRDCAADANDCINAANIDPDIFALTLLSDGEIRKKQLADGGQQPKLTQNVDNNLILSTMYNEYVMTTLATSSADSETKSCKEGCIASMFVNSTSFVYNPAEQQQERLIGPLASDFRIRAYSGLDADLSKDVSVYVEGVPHSIMANATNRVTYSRVKKYGKTLTFAQSLLSPAISCTVGEGIKQPFNVPMSISSNIDRTVAFSYADVCLARLRRFPERNYQVWECIYSEEQRKSGKYSVVTDVSIENSAVQSEITTCIDPDLASQNINAPAVYAFILSPVQSEQVYKQSLDTFWRDNIIWILLAICGGVLIIFVIVYAITRLTRYSGKLEQAQKDVAVMEEEVEEQENFGGQAGTKDEQVMTTANPLAIQLADMQAVHAEDPAETQRKAKEKLEEQQMEQAERQEVIDVLQQETDRNLAQLEQMKQQLNQTSGPSRL